MRKSLAVATGLLLWMAGLVALVLGLRLRGQLRPNEEFFGRLVMLSTGLIQAAWVAPLVIVVRRHRAILSGILVGAVLGGAISARLLLWPPALPVEIRTFLAQSFELQHRWDTIPEPTRQAFFATVSGQRDFCARRPGECRMANEGEPWNETDMNTDESLPYRRLIAGGESPQQAFLFYEAGGMGVRLVLLVFDKRDGVLHPSWSTFVSRRCRSVFMLRAWLRYNDAWIIPSTRFREL